MTFWRCRAGQRDQPRLDLAGHLRLHRRGEPLLAADRRLDVATVVGIGPWRSSPPCRGAHRPAARPPPGSAPAHHVQDRSRPDPTGSGLGVPAGPDATLYEPASPTAHARPGSTPPAATSTLTSSTRSRRAEGEGTRQNWPARPAPSISGDTPVGNASLGRRSAVHLCCVPVRACDPMVSTDAGRPIFEAKTLSGALR